MAGDAQDRWPFLVHVGSSLQLDSLEVPPGPFRLEIRLDVVGLDGGGAAGLCTLVQGVLREHYFAALRQKIREVRFSWGRRAVFFGVMS